MGARFHFLMKSVVVAAAGLSVGASPDGDRGRGNQSTASSKTIVVEKPSPDSKFKKGESFFVKGKVNVPKGTEAPEVIEVTVLSSNGKIQAGQTGLRLGRSEGDDYYIERDGEYRFQTKRDGTLKPGRYSVRVKSIRVVRGGGDKLSTESEEADKVAIEIQK